MNRLASHISLTFVALFTVILGGQTTINSKSDGNFQKYLSVTNNSFRDPGNDALSLDKIKSLLHKLPLATLKDIKTVANKDAEMGRRYILKMLPRGGDSTTAGTATSLLKMKSTFIDNLLKDLDKRREESSFWKPDNPGQRVPSQTSSPILLENFEVFQIPSDLFMKSLPTATLKPDKYLVFDHVVPPHRGKELVPTAPPPWNSLPHTNQLLHRDVKLEKNPVIPANYVANQHQGYVSSGWEDWPTKTISTQQQPYTIHVQPNQNSPTNFHQIFPQHIGQLENSNGNAPNLPLNQIWDQNQQNPWPNIPTTTMSYQSIGIPEYTNSFQISNSMSHVIQPQSNPPPSHSYPIQSYPQPNQQYQQTSQPYPQPQPNQPYQQSGQPYPQPNQPIQWPQYYPAPSQNAYYGPNPYPQYQSIDNQPGWSQPQAPGWLPQQYYENNYGWPSEDNKSGEKSKEKKKGLFHSLHNAIFGDKHKDKGKENENDEDYEKDKWKQWLKLKFEDKDKHKGKKSKGKAKGSSEYTYGWETAVSDDNTEASDTYADTYDHYSQTAEEWMNNASSLIYF